MFWQKIGLSLDCEISEVVKQFCILKFDGKHLKIIFQAYTHPLTYYLDCGTKGLYLWEFIIEHKIKLPQATFWILHQIPA